MIVRTPLLHNIVALINLLRLTLSSASLHIKVVLALTETLVVARSTHLLLRVRHIRLLVDILRYYLRIWALIRPITFSRAAYLVIVKECLVGILAR